MRHAAVDVGLLHVAVGSTGRGHEVVPGLVGLVELVHGLVLQHVGGSGKVILASRRPHLEEQR